MKEVELTDSRQLVEIINDAPNGYVFRGQADASWSLASSLERLLEHVWSNEDFDIKKYEDYTFRRFVGKYRLYSKDAISPASKLETLSLMQHHGVPTRLLDFTESPYLALYFAMESYNPFKGNDFALYAIDCTALMKHSLLMLRESDGSFKHDLASLEDDKDAVFDDVVERTTLDLLWITEPKMMNRRLDLQSGTFITSINTRVKIEDAIMNPKYAGVEMTKYRMPSQMYEHVYALLRQANVTSKSIYGDLDGLGRSIRMELAAYARPKSNLEMP